MSAHRLCRCGAVITRNISATCSDCVLSKRLYGRGLRGVELPPLRKMPPVLRALAISTA